MASQILAALAVLACRAASGAVPGLSPSAVFHPADALEETEDSVLMSFDGAPTVVFDGPAAPTVMDLKKSGLAEPAASLHDGPWEARFAAALEESNIVVAAATDADAGRFVSDPLSTGGVPARMLEVETAMARALEAAPEGKVWREKAAVQALRLYNHAKWLAERNHFSAAEERYLKVKDLALQAKRKVLAGHALSRLGYFLMIWGRFEEAREVLKESHSTSQKSNPLAPYLLGVLERKAAGADIERLMAADALVLAAEEQPSKELEQERQRLVEEINFWKEAEGNSMKCVDGTSVAHVLICFAMNAALAMKGILS